MHAVVCIVVLKESSMCLHILITMSFLSFSPLALWNQPTHSWWQTQHHRFHTVCYTYTVYTAHCARCYKSQSTVERPCAKRNFPSLTPASWAAVCDSIWQKYVEGVHEWAGTCPLCPVNGDSWHSCLYRVSMELCCRWRQQCLMWHLSVISLRGEKLREPARLCTYKAWRFSCRSLKDFYQILSQK